MSKIRKLLHLPDDMSALEMIAWAIILPFVIWGIVRICPREGGNWGIGGYLPPSPSICFEILSVMSASRSTA